MGKQWKQCQTLFFGAVDGDIKKQRKQEMQLQSLGREDPLEEEMANPLQYSCLENPMDRRTWWATVQQVSKSQTRLNKKLPGALIFLLTSSPVGPWPIQPNECSVIRRAFPRVLDFTNLDTQTMAASMSGINILCFPRDGPNAVGSYELRLSRTGTEEMPSV